MKEAKLGRPSAGSTFTPWLGDKICAHIAKGRSLRSICKDEDMPCYDSILKWICQGQAENASEDFAYFTKQYTRARELQADYLADETLDIADDGSNDWMKREGKHGEPSWELNGEHVQRSRLRIDQRKWYAGKLNSKKYGDKTVQEHVGKDDGPIQLENVTDKDRAAALMRLLAETKKD